MILSYGLAIITGYLLGCSNMALYLSKARGIDLRAAGSGNLGTCNALMVMDWKSAVLVCLHDMGKAVLAVLLMQSVFPRLPLIGYVAGTACVLGHIYPFYLGFKGGKGFASFLGMALAIDWKFGLILLAATAVLTVVSDYIVVATVLTVIAFPTYTGIVTGDWRPALIVWVATAAILWKHRENYVRILNGTEQGLRKVAFAKKK